MDHHFRQITANDDKMNLLNSIGLFWTGATLFIFTTTHIRFSHVHSSLFKLQWLYTFPTKASFSCAPARVASFSTGNTNCWYYGLLSHLCVCVCVFCINYSAWIPRWRVDFVSHGGCSDVLADLLYHLLVVTFAVFWSTTVSECYWFCRWQVKWVFH